MVVPIKMHGMVGELLQSVGEITMFMVYKEVSWIMVDTLSL